MLTQFFYNVKCFKLLFFSKAKNNKKYFHCLFFWKKIVFSKKITRYRNAKKGYNFNEEIKGAKNEKKR